MKKYFLLLSMFVAGVVLLNSCSDKDDEPQLPGSVNVVEYVDATSYTDWVYFSFEKGEEVEVSDYANDLSWDIAFHRSDIRLNGGKSGKGQGEVVNMNTTEWNDVKEAPKSGYIKDEIGIIITAFTGTGIDQVEQPFSQTLTTWLTIITNPLPPTYSYNNWVFVVKTVSGKYVKLQIYDYRDARNTAAYISFRYQYNESGSDKFE